MALTGRQEAARERMGQGLYDAIHRQWERRIHTFVVDGCVADCKGPNEYTAHGFYEVDVRWVPCPCDECQERWLCPWNRKHDLGQLCTCDDEQLRQSEAPIG